MIPQKYLPKENKMFTCNSYLNDMITYRASHCSLSQVLFQFFGCFADIKADMESHVVQWQGKLDELHVFQEVVQITQKVTIQRR